MARLGWLALGVLMGVLGRQVAARRTEPPQSPPVLAAATRVELAPAPSPAATETNPETTPETAPRPTPSPRPRHRPEQPAGRHAWVPPEPPTPNDDAGTAEPPRDDASGGG